METKKWKSYNPKAIANNLQLIFRTKDIEKLNKSTYGYLYLLSGFIAHYDLSGFRAYYQDLRDLIRDLDTCYDINYPREESSGEQVEYFKSKYDTAIEVKKVVEEFENEIWTFFSKDEQEKDILTIKSLMRKNNLMEVRR